MQSQVDIDEILHEARIYAPHAPELLLTRFLREAAIEFCAATLAWRDNDSWDLARREDRICTGPAAEVISIESARLDDVDLVPVSLDWLDEHHPGWNDDTDEIAAPRWVTQIAPDTLIVAPFVPGRLKARMTLKPSRTTETLPRFLIDHHAALLGEGAAGRVLTVPGDWANPQLGAALYGKFQAALPARKFVAAKGQQQARRRTRARFF